ncbi:AAA family ATPase [Leucobacter chromiireducens]|uniref:AAA family ATPase n=1 Tax=Leucobacter chromiireducens TaxID=283877 RepID=UPI000F62FA2B|nr:MoxR family ATPase [Leucobacter chromiireducens]
MNAQPQDPRELPVDDDPTLVPASPSTEPATRPSAPLGGTPGGGAGGAGGALSAGGAAARDDGREALSPEQARWVQQVFAACADALGEVIQGKRRVIELVLASTFAGGHVLLEDVPGTGKTALARALAAVIQGTASRIQFTPDLLPGDVTGISVFDQRAGVFEFHAGPVFANVVLADEINRASPKTQSALLEVMEEARVTVDGVSHEVGHPFLVIATQNPIEQAGTYRLPEAQLDRFMIKTTIGYPDASAMLRILEQHRRAQAPIEPVVTTAMVAQAQALVDRVHVSPLVADYAVQIVEATRRAREVRLGASVRGALALVRLATAWAAAAGRHYVTPDDVRDLALPTLAHRLVLEPEAEFDGVTAEQIVGQVLLDVPLPRENGTA